MRKVLLLLAIAASALGVSALAGAEPGGPSGQGVQPQQVAMTAANACSGGQKIEDPADGTYAVDYPIGSKDWGTLTIDVHNGSSGPTFDFVTSAWKDLVTSMYVKGGPTANFYDYSAKQYGGVSWDTGLHAPVNPANGKFYGLSHICIFTDKY
jgi:hypothetical protein